MQNKFWQILAIGWLLMQTLCLVVVLEFLILGRPYLTLFLLIFAGTLHFNISRHPNLPISGHWPFFKKE